MQEGRGIVQLSYIPNSYSARRLPKPHNFEGVGIIFEPSTIIPNTYQRF